MGTRRTWRSRALADEMHRDIRLGFVAVPKSIYLASLDDDALWILLVVQLVVHGRGLPLLSYMGDRPWYIAVVSN